MDTIRFLSFLQDFAANNVQKLTTTTTSSGKNLPNTDLANTFSAFESQLKAIMTTPAAPAEQVSHNKAQTDNSGFVVGGGTGTMSDGAAAVTEAMLARVIKPDTNKSDLPSEATSTGTNLSEHDKALREIIAWRREQIDPMLHVRVGDIWDRQGITDPMSHPKLLAEAQLSHERAMSRKVHMPNITAQWEGDWRAKLATELQNLAEQRSQSAANSTSSPFVIGGGHTQTG